MNARFPAGSLCPPVPFSMAVHFHTHGLTTKLVSFPKQANSLFLSQNHQLPAGEISCSFKLLSFLSCQSSHPGSPTPSTVGTAPGTHLPTIPPCFQGFSNAARAEGRSHREGGSETPTLSATLSLQLKELCKDARGSHTLSSSHYQAPATGGLCIQHLLI